MKRLLPLLIVLGLSACGDSDVQEVRKWMDDTTKQTKVSITPIPAPKKYEPFAYTGKDATDPFSQQKLSVELARAAASSKNPFKPDTNRRKELLESFPLDTIKMVGVIEKAGVNYGLVQVDKSLFQVRAGNFIGQNYGKVLSVSEDAIAIREVVQDAAGEWIERDSKLELQEAKEAKETKK